MDQYMEDIAREKSHTTHFDDCGCKSRKYEERITALKAERDALKEENAKLRDGMKRAAFVDYRKGVWGTYCVGCGYTLAMVAHEGHSPGCWLDALLKGE